MSLNRRRFLREVALAGSSALSLGAAQDVRPTGAVTVRVVDEKSRRPLAARVRLVDSQNREVVPLGHSPRLTEGAQEGDAQYYIRYMDLSIRWLETEAKFARSEDKQASLEAFRIGRAIYERRAKEARRA